jgi:hypothetical protein
MLTPQDDLIGHQLPTTFDQIDNSDPAWMERLWYTGHPIPNSDIIFDIGLGYYPNRNVMDAFAGVAIFGKQWNFRASRRLRPNPLVTSVGPLAIQVIEGLRRHRLSLSANDSGIRFDIEFIADLHAHEEKGHLRRRQGRVTENMARVQQLGRYAGWLEFDGRQRIEIDTAGWVGQRDHSWGVRSEMRTDETSPPLTFYPPFFYCWATAQFANRGLHIFFKERAPGEKIYISGEEVFPIGTKVSSQNQLVDARHEVLWLDDPLGQSMESAVLKLKFADDRERAVSIRTLPTRYFLKGGLYGGLDGWFHGDDRGNLYFEHDIWNLTEPGTRKRVRTLADQIIEMRDGNEVGYGIIEYGVGSGFATYESVQAHPPI